MHQKKVQARMFNKLNTCFMCSFTCKRTCFILKKKKAFIHSFRSDFFFFSVIVVVGDGGDVAAAEHCHTALMTF